MIGLIGALALLGPGCSPDPAPASGGPPPGPRPALVKVAPAESGQLTDRSIYLGQVRPQLETTLAAGVAAQVVSVEPREGDTVEAGAVLVELDTSIITPRQAVASAEIARVDAELAQARRELDRASSLPTSVVPTAERERFAARVDTLRAQARSARATAQQLAAELARHTIEAPFSGLVTTRHVDPGAWVNPGQPLVHIVAVQALEVVVDVDPRIAPYVEVGARATLLGQPPLEATVIGVVRALDPRTRTLRVRLAPEGQAPWLMPRAQVQVELEVPIGGDGVIVPRDALVRGPVNVRVIRVDGEKTESIGVEVLGTAGDRALVRGEGLAPGDSLIVRGNERLRPGQPITVVP